jgi:hypothetical protein
MTCTRTTFSLPWTITERIQLVKISLYGMREVPNTILGLGVRILWWNCTNRRKPKHLEKAMTQYHFVHHKSYTDRTSRLTFFLVFIRSSRQMKLRWLSVEVNIRRSYNSSVAYAFMTWPLLKHKYNYTKRMTYWTPSWPLTKSFTFSTQVLLLKAKIMTP